jgi:hypothetical protein
MKLHPVLPLRLVANGRHGARIRGRQHHKAGRRLGHRVPVAHPHLLMVGDILEQRAGPGNIQVRQAIFAFHPFRDGAIQTVGHQLLAIADPQHRQIRLQ